ncbi:MAG: AAA family ATPase [Lentisphaerae bacterium]|nr:AAA family ATPase [Lentisphaerota bacterium]
MSYCNEVSNKWMEVRAAFFLVNFLKNHRQDIDNSSVFHLLDIAVSNEKFQQAVKEHFSSAEQKKIQSLLDKELEADSDPEDILSTLWACSSLRNKLRTLVEKILDDYCAGIPEDQKVPEPNWTEFVKMTKLTPFEEDILLVARCVSKNLLAEIYESCRSSAEDAIDFMAKCLDAPRGKVIEAVAENANLRRFDCLDSDLDFCFRLEDFFSGLRKDPLTSRYFTKFKREPLPWDFYGELAVQHGELLKKLIRSGKSVNILLYGAPGTGKTSFAQSLAAELELDCYNIAQCNERGNDRSDSSPDFRFAALQICDNQVSHDKSLLVVDEADEMLQGNSFAYGSSNAWNEKGRLNAVLDSLQTPVIWITNIPARALDESSRRRFDYSIKFEELTARQRVAIWRNSIAKMRLKKYFTEEMISEFSEKYPVSAGGIANVLKNLACIKPAKAEVASLVQKLMSIHCELMDISSSEDNKLLPAKDYSLEGLNISGDLKLEMIVGAARKFLSENPALSPDRPRFNLLLAGPPGTGKSEFVKFLARELGRKIHVCMGSDLLDMYVGGTEQNIKAAFARAEAEKAILFLDEIDGMVQSRERAHNSWEVTQVNELLYQMENFNGIMIGATNFIKNLDPAIMRRFTFKLDFNFLDNEGKKIFFERMFKTQLTPDELSRLEAIANLAPGDFRTVRQALYYLEDNSNPVRLAALEKESAAKPYANKSTSTKLGF